MRVLIPPRPITKNIIDDKNIHHTHSSWEIVLFNTGLTKHYYATDQLKLCKLGDVAFVGPTHQHHIETEEGPRSHTDVYFSDAEFHQICDLYSETLYDKMCNSYITFKIDPLIAKSIINQLQSIEINLQINQDHFDLLKQISLSILNQLLSSYMLERFNRKNNLPDWIYNLLTDLQNPTNLINPPNYFFNKYNYSRSRFASLFKKYTGITFSEYLIQKRMEYAADLLLKTTKTTLEICTIVGYDSYPFFLKSFKKIYSISPKDYRNNSTKTP